MAASNRKSGKKLALWMSADADTAPVAGDKVAYITGLNFTSRANISNVTAAGDAAARKAGGIPDGSCRVAGRVNFAAGQFDMLNAHRDQSLRQFAMVYEEDGVNDSNGLVFTALVSEFGQAGQHTSPWDFTAQLEIDDEVNPSA